MKRVPLATNIVLTGLLALACSGGGASPVAPEFSGIDLTQAAQSAAGTSSSKALWGYWEIRIDTQAWETEIVPLRGAEYTVNVVTFLQPPAGSPANLSIKVTDVSDWLTEGRIGVEVGLRHPFPGYDQYTGFDVYGVFAAPGSVAGQYDSDVAYTNGADEPILLKSDGYTRWMNPIEFPENGTIFNFITGKLGTPNIALFTSTINGYKYFADTLKKDEDVGDFFSVSVHTDARGMFRPGSYNVREYDLKFPLVGGVPEITFQYAVIASWVDPDKSLSGDPDVLDVPDDFPPSANADEAVFIDVNDKSTLYYVDGNGGGSVSLELEVYDWGALLHGGEVLDEIHQIIVEGTPGAIPGGYVFFDKTALASTASAGTSVISSVFEVEIANCTPQSPDDLPLLITIESENPDMFDPGNGIAANDDRLAAYFRHDVPVSAEVPIEVISPNGGETLWMAMSHEITWDTGGDAISQVAIEWSIDNFVSDVRTVVAGTENDGSHLWRPIPNVETDSARVRVRDASGAASDTSDGDFSIALPVWLDFEDAIAIDDTTVTWNREYAAMPWDEFSPVLDQNQDGLVHICWHGQGWDYNWVGWWLKWGWDVVIRSTDGSSWNGEGSFFTTTGAPDHPDPFRLDHMKIATAANDKTFAAIEHFKVYFCADVDYWMHPTSYYYNSWITNDCPLIYNNCEIMTDSDYLYMVGDGYRGPGAVDGPGVYSVRVVTPTGLTIWENDPINTFTESGEVSHCRSWAIHDGTLVLGCYTANGEIKLLKQTDQVSDAWDDTEVIFDGTGYTGCKDPSIAVDASGRLFAVWTGKQDASGEYELLASMKETSTGAWTEPIIAASSESPFDDQHVSCSSEPVALPTGDDEYLVLIGYECDGFVYSRISPKDLWAFLPAQQVSADGATSRDPDTLCLWQPYIYDSLFAWSFQVDDENWDIAIRNADFETP